MTVKEFSITFRVNNKSALKCCRAGLFGARKIAGGAWEITDPPIVKMILTVSEAAERLSLTPRYIEQLCRAERIRAIRVGNLWRICGESFQRFINERANNEI